MVDIEGLENKARQIRIDIVKSLNNAESGHLGGSLGLSDVFTALYFHLLSHQPQNPNWTQRDRFVLSIGHVAPVYYTTLAHAGYFPVDELKTLRKLGSRLQGHPGRDHGLPGIELSAGSLGQGLSVAVGMAMAAKIDSESWKVVCLLGDGELQEGAVWEAAMSASHHKLNGLVAVVDRNYVQIDGSTADVMELEPLRQKWEAFSWEVLTCDGNNMAEFIRTFEQACTDKPSVILAHTIMGKGVGEIEGDYRWHGKAPSNEECIRFIDQIVG